MCNISRTAVTDPAHTWVDRIHAVTGEPMVYVDGVGAPRIHTTCAECGMSSNRVA